MKLDKRIKTLSDILTCFDIEKAKQYIGQKGYFEDYLHNYNSLENDQKEYGTLTEVLDSEVPFKSDNRCHWRFFLPESKLLEFKKKEFKPFANTKEKTYRPFANTKEFFLMRNFEVGDLIHIRSKGDNKEYHLLIAGYTDEELMLGNLQGLSLNELLHWFELWDCEDNKFKPFGFEE